MLHWPELPTEISVQDFDALHDDPTAWREAITALAATRSPLPVRQADGGTVLVALLGETEVLKLVPPFYRQQWAFERAALLQLGGTLSVPTPQLLDSGEHRGWTWLRMTQLHGEPLTARWPALDEPSRLALLQSIGALAAEVHARPVGAVAQQAPAWPDFLARQRAGCLARQQRLGVPAHLLQQLPAFLDGPVPEGPDVILTGEYTPMNLLVQQGHLAGMYDFGDGLVGPAAYDWLGPLCFFCAGQPRRRQAFLQGYGVLPPSVPPEPLLRLLLLHKYSNLPAQLALPGWQEAPSWEALAHRLWG